MWLAVLTVGTAVACRSEPAPVRRVTIPQGASFAAAAESLESAGVLGSPRLFRLYASATRRDRDIKAGTYLLEPGLSWSELIDALTAGRGIEHSVTIPEGLALRDIVPLLARTTGAPVVRASSGTMSRSANPSGMVTLCSMPRPAVSALISSFHERPGSSRYVPALMSRSRRVALAYRRKSRVDPSTPALSSDSAAAAKLAPCGIVTRSTGAGSLRQATSTPTLTAASHPQ